MCSHLSGFLVKKGQKFNMELKKHIKKRLFNKSYDHELHIGQQICLLLQGVLILFFIFYYDLTGHWIIEFLAAILAFAIVVIVIGMIWLARLIWNFSDKYKLSYITDHPETAKYLVDQEEQKHPQEKVNNTNAKRQKKKKRRRKNS